ncbi:MAG: hypothetical protein LDL33_05380 [Desulfomonile sp.]|nr:hypothetical protein [Desulfomonile sp.]
MKITVPTGRLVPTSTFAIAVVCAFFTCISSSYLPTAAASGYERAAYVLPPEVQKNGIAFAEAVVPIDRKDVANRVVEQINYLLMDRRAGLLEWFDRMALYGPMILPVLSQEKVPEDMIYLAAVLSDLLPNFRSKSGGVGWWALGAVKQEKSSSAVQWVVTNDWDDRRDPVISTRLACTIFQWLRGRKDGVDWLLAICGFLDGAERVEQVVKNAPGFSYWDLPVPPRSEVIIPRLIALKIIREHRELYGVAAELPPPLEYDTLDKVLLLKDLPLYVVAQWCKTNPRSMWELNPGVDPSSGVIPKPDKRTPAGFPLRVPRGMGKKVHELLMKNGYLAG